MTHTNWRILSDRHGLPQSCIHFIEPEVGAASARAAKFYPEDLLIPFAPGIFENHLLDRRRSGKSQSQNSQRQQITG